MNACSVSVLIGRDTTGMTCLKNFRSMSGFSGGAGAEGASCSAQGAEHCHVAVLLPDNINRIENRNLVSADIKQMLTSKRQVGSQHPLCCPIQYHLDGCKAGEAVRMPSQQVKQSKTLRVSSGQVAVVLDDRGALFKFLAQFGIELINRIGDKRVQR